jgi:hypothetical protein
MAIDDTDPLQQTSNEYKLVRDRKRHTRPAKNPRENAIKGKCRWYDLVATVRQKFSKERKFKCIVSYLNRGRVLFGKNGDFYQESPTPRRVRDMPGHPTSRGQKRIEERDDVLEVRGASQITMVLAIEK